MMFNLIREEGPKSVRQSHTKRKFCDKEEMGLENSSFLCTSFMNDL